MKAKIRNALVTWNNPPTKDWDDLVAMLNPAYMVGQLERGEAGTLHWQFAVQWQNPRSFAAIKKDLPLAHFEEVRSWAAAVTYCQKADTRDSGPWEFGTRPTGGSGKAQAEDWETWYQLAAEGKFKEIPPKFKSSTWAIWSAFTARISNSSTKQMCAESGFGALRSRQEPLCPPSAGSRGLLPKLNNKWWDGYQSQKVVIMEDVDKETVKFLHHHLKIWADRWGSLARPRGRGCPHSPMAGSNFQLQHHGHPQGPRGPPAQEAITRRFMRFEMLSRDEIKNWDTYETVTPEAVAAIFK